MPQLRLGESFSLPIVFLSALLLSTATQVSVGITSGAYLLFFFFFLVLGCKGAGMVTHRWAGGENSPAERSRVGGAWERRMEEKGDNVAALGVLMWKRGFWSEESTPVRGVSGTEAPTPPDAAETQTVCGSKGNKFSFPWRPVKAVRTQHSSVDRQHMWTWMHNPGKPRCDPSYSFPKFPPLETSGYTI